MDDLDEFLELVGTAEPTFDICENLNNIKGCAVVVATGRCERTKQKCFICKKPFVVCDCGKGMVLGDSDNMICVVVGDIKCPRIAEPPDDE